MKKIDKTVEELIFITNKIQKVYDLIFSNEINNEDKSKNLKYLNELISRENRLYKLIENKKFPKYYIYTKINNNKTNDELTDILKFEKIQISKRVLRKLFKNQLKEIEKEISDNLILEEFEDFLEEKNIEEKLNDTLKCIEYIKFDFLIVYLYFTEQNIKDIEYNDIKNYLKKEKYNISFTNELIEKELLNKNFQVDKINTISNIFKEVSWVNDADYYRLTSNFSVNRAEEIFPALIKIKDNDYDNNLFNLEATIKLNYLKSAFNLFTVEDLNSYKEEIIDRIETFETNDTLSIEKLLDIVDESSNDIQKQK